MTWSPDRGVLLEDHSTPEQRKEAMTAISRNWAGVQDHSTPEQRKEAMTISNKDFSVMMDHSTPEQRKEAMTEVAPSRKRALK